MNFNVDDAPCTVKVSSKDLLFAAEMQDEKMKRVKEGEAASTERSVYDEIRYYAPLAVGFNYVLEPYTPKRVTLDTSFSIPFGYLGTIFPYSAIVATGLLVQPELVKPMRKFPLGVTVTNINAEPLTLAKGAHIAELVLNKAVSIRYVDAAATTTTSSEAACKDENIADEVELIQGDESNDVEILEEKTVL